MGRFTLAPGKLDLTECRFQAGTWKPVHPVRPFGLLSGQKLSRVWSGLTRNPATEVRHAAYGCGYKRECKQRLQPFKNVMTGARVVSH
jgi:hypothetical protein